MNLTDEEQKIIQKAIKTWGNQAQLLMVLEEMSELQKEILKNINRHQQNMEAIVDETADVLIMIEQLQQIYQIKEAVRARIPQKLKKIQNRLGE